MHASCWPRCFTLPRTQQHVRGHAGVGPSEPSSCAYASSTQVNARTAEREGLRKPSRLYKTKRLEHALKGLIRPSGALYLSFPEYYSSVMSPFTILVYFLFWLALGSC